MGSEIHSQIKFFYNNQAENARTGEFHLFIKTWAKLRPLRVTNV